MKKAEGLNTILGATIKKLRLENGLTQEQLAERCETSAVYISEIERGIKQPTFNSVYVICESLHLDLNEFASHLEKHL